jgi:ribosomal protein S26
MSRGREPLVTCDACGRVVPRDKAVEYIKSVNLDINQKETVLDLTRSKVYYCISCAKHRKIFEKKKKRLRNDRQ